MKTGIILLSLLLIILSCAEEKTADLKLGEKVFKINCVICHGRDGKLAINGAKDLGLSTLSLSDRILIIKEGKNLMTPFKALLNDEQIRAVAQYSLKFTNAQ